MNKQEIFMNQKKEYVKPEAKEVAFFCQQSLLQEASCEDEAFCGMFD